MDINIKVPMRYPSEFTEHEIDELLINSEYKLLADDHLLRFRIHSLMNTIHNVYSFGYILSIDKTDDGFVVDVEVPHKYGPYIPENPVIIPIIILDPSKSFGFRIQHFEMHHLKLIECELNERS